MTGPVWERSEDQEPGVTLDDVVLVGQGGVLVPGLRLMFDAGGLKVLGPGEQARRSVPWAAAQTVSFRQAAALPDGRPATVLRVALADRELLFLVPVAQVNPAKAASIEADLIRLKGGIPLSGGTGGQATHPPISVGDDQGFFGQPAADNAEQGPIAPGWFKAPPPTSEVTEGGVYWEPRRWDSAPKWRGAGSGSRSRPLPGQDQVLSLSKPRSTNTRAIVAVVFAFMVIVAGVLTLVLVLLSAHHH